MLVLTAPNTPPEGARRLQRSDPNLRRQDYCEALEWYLRADPRVVSRIVFVENSNSDLSIFHELAGRLGKGKDVEIVSVYGMDHDPSFTRGYGEFKLLDRALQASRILSALGDADVFWKVTGRYRVRNLEALFSNAPAEFELYADVRPIRQYFDTRVFGETVAGYNGPAIVAECIRNSSAGAAKMCCMRS